MKTDMIHETTPIAWEDIPTHLRAALEASGWSRPEAVEPGVVEALEVTGEVTGARPRTLLDLRREGMSLESMAKKGLLKGGGGGCGCSK